VSSQSTIPLFGRAYSLKLLNGSKTLQVTNDKWEPEALRITFEVEQIYRSNAYWATIKIYNLSDGTAQSALSSVTIPPSTNTGTPPIIQGDEVQLSAGYQTGNNASNIIFDGNVFQPMWTKEDVVDYVVQLECYLGFGPFKGQIVSTNFQGGIDQLTVVKRIAQEAGIKYNSAQIDEEVLASVKLPKGGTIFGPPNRFLQQIAAQHQMAFCHLADGSFVMQGPAAFTDNVGKPQYKFSPPIPPGLNVPLDPSVNYTIIGTPQQTEQGVVFRVLMDPRMKVDWPLTVIEIDNSAIRQLAMAYGQAPIAALASDGVYVVIGVRHVGDTRGNDWYTELNCVTPKGVQTAYGVGGK
jgi:hypothetical protein